MKNIDLLRRELRHARQAIKEVQKLGLTRACFAGTGYYYFARFPVISTWPIFFRFCPFFLLLFYSVFYGTNFSM